MTHQVSLSCLGMQMSRTDPSYFVNETEYIGLSCILLDLGLKG